MIRNYRNAASIILKLCLTNSLVNDVLKSVRPHATDLREMRDMLQRVLQCRPVHVAHSPAWAGLLRMPAVLESVHHTHKHQGSPERDWTPGTKCRA